MNPVPSADLNQYNPWGYITSLGGGTSMLVGPVFELAGTALIFYFLFGTVKMLMSGGEKEAVAGAKNMITHAIVGFLLLVVMFLVLEFIFPYFGINSNGVITPINP